MRLHRFALLVLVALCHAGIFLGLGLGPVAVIGSETAAQLERCAAALDAAGG